MLIKPTMPLKIFRGQFPRQLPETIQTMLEQMGGFGTGSAMCYIGARHSHFRDNYDQWTSSTIDECGNVQYSRGLDFEVKTRASGPLWHLYVTYEPCDTYTVRLWQPNRMDVFVDTGIAGKVVEEIEDVYCDELQSVVEQVYDKHLKPF